MKLTMAFLAFPIGAASFTKPQYVFRQLSRIMSPVAASPTTMFEVEEKFPLLNRNRDELEDRLRELGFSTVGNVNMIDWYYDTFDFTLIRHDCWLRCREVGDAREASEQQWQLKRGTPRESQSESARSTTSVVSSNVLAAAAVYEEVEGDNAVEVVRALLASVPTQANSSSDDSNRLLDARDAHVVGTDTSMVPILPLSISGLHMFAKIVTQRTSWKAQAGRFQPLTVDLDTTDFNYAVGEVEMIVTDVNQVEAAKTSIHELIQAFAFSSSNSNERASGKMECYLKKNRPDVYQICIDSGVL